jgi:hypothetical protein
MAMVDVPVSFGAVANVMGFGVGAVESPPPDAGRTTTVPAHHSSDADIVNVPGLSVDDATPWLAMAPRPAELTSGD